jgi:tyrosyl-tRNA synthetase
MLMQGYDFYKLNRDYGCKMEFGGDDQWSNIIGGIELIRKKAGKSAYGMTFTLLTNSEGKKMGKTEKGALWLDAEKVSPYEFYQYWRNVDDRDVIRMLKLVTFIPMEEIREYEKLEGQELNKVKALLAYEVTKMVHGEEEAKKAQEAAQSVFGAGAANANMPTFELSEAELADGMNVIDLMVLSGLVPSKGEGRRVIQQGGLSVDGEKVTDIAEMITKDRFNDGIIIIKKGKKVFIKIQLV